MSEFRIFCVGALAFGVLTNLIGKPLGDAAVSGSTASFVLQLFILTLGGTIAVAFFGKRRAV